MLQEGYVTVPISNMLRSIRFYTKALGLKLRYRAGNEWAEIKGPAIILGLHPMMEMRRASKPGKSCMSIGFTVKKLETEMAHLKKKGVRFAPKIMDEGPVRLAFFNDPDGNPLHLCEVKE